MRAVITRVKNASVVIDGAEHAAIEKGFLVLLGVHVEGAFVEVRPHVPGELSFAQGCLLLGRGLLVVRVENDGDATRLGVSLPPGMVGVLALGDERREVVSGRHSITGSMAERH